MARALLFWNLARNSFMPLFLVLTNITFYLYSLFFFIALLFSLICDGEQMARDNIFWIPIKTVCILVQSYKVHYERTRVSLDFKAPPNLSSWLISLALLSLNCMFSGTQNYKSRDVMSSLIFSLEKNGTLIHKFPWIGLKVLLLSMCWRQLHRKIINCTEWAI